ncbi:MAG: hypothetical protein AAGG65_14185 [Pseudomonadota bacterium]
MIRRHPNRVQEDSMRTLIIGLLQIVAIVGFILMIVMGAYMGYAYEQLVAAQNIAGVAIDPVLGAVIGAIGGLVAAVITFGVVFLLIDIRAQTKRTAQVLEDLAKRRPATQTTVQAPTTPQAPTPPQMPPQPTPAPGT